MAEDVRARRALKPRAILRAVHRDAGYLAVGLTFVYAVSGLAVNHITDFTDGDPSFRSYQRTHALGPLAAPNDADAERALADDIRHRLAIATPPREVYRQSPTELDILFDRRSLHVDLATGHVLDEGQEPRFLLRALNWLHLNRGKKAWTYVADAYAAGLLLLAGSGMFMIAGKKGLAGRGALLVALGIAIPVAYVTLTGP